MTNQALQRTKDIALNLAHGGFTQLFKQCYKEIRENDTRTYNININGRPVQYSPTQFPEAMDVTVDTTISPGDKASKAQAMAALLAMVNQVPAVSQLNLFGPEQQYNFLHEYAKALNFDNLGSFMLPLEQGQPNPPDPNAGVQVELVKSDIMLKQAQAMQAQSVAQKNGADVQLDTQKLIFEQQAKASEDDLKEKSLSFEQDRAAVQDTISRDKLTLEKMKLGIEAQLEASQKRPVGLGN